MVCSFALRMSPILFLIAGVGLSACATGPDAESPFVAQAHYSLDMDVPQSDGLLKTDPINPVDGTPYKVYEVSLERDDILRATVESSEFSPTLSLFGPDGSVLATSERPSTAPAPAAHIEEPAYFDVPGVPGAPDPGAHYGAGPAETYDSINGHADLIRSVTQTGDYVLVVSSRSADERGSYNIDVGVLDELAELSYPGSINAHLYAGASLHPDTGAPRVAHPIDVEEKTLVEVAYGPRRYAGYVSIVDADTGAILESKSGLTGDEFRILTELEPGSYEIWASATDSGASGAYSLRVGEADIEISDHLVIGDSFDSYLGIDRQAIPESGGHRRGQPIEFDVDEEGLLQATMRSNDVDSYLILTDADGRLLNEDDDSGGDYDAQIVHPVEPGRYTLWATSYGEETDGHFRIESQVRERPEHVDAVAVGSTIDGLLSADAARYGERNTRIEYFDLPVEEDTTIEIEVRSEQFDTYLVLEDDAGHKIAENDDHEGTTSSRIEHRVSAGTYRVGVTSYGPDDYGLFSLSVAETSSSSRASLFGN